MLQRLYKSGKLDDFKKLADKVKIGISGPDGKRGKSAVVRKTISDYRLAYQRLLNLTSEGQVPDPDKIRDRTLAKLVDILWQKLENQHRMGYKSELVETSYGRGRQASVAQSYAQLQLLSLMRG